jgi:Bacteriophage tail sheath protein
MAIMPKPYKTPDVYVEEISLFPPSVAEVGTAIPAFIGYTEKAKRITDNDLILKPTKIRSLPDYERMFGFPKADTLTLTVVADPEVPGAFLAELAEPALSYLMYFAIKMFFDNGGSQCYIVSVGLHQAAPSITLAGDTSTNPATMYGLQDGLNAVAQEDEPTLIVIPEAIKLSAADYATLVQAVLAQCGKLGDRFGIFDIYDGGAELTSGTGGGQETNRAHFSINNLKYGAAYYPFVKTSLNYFVKDDETNVQITDGTAAAVTLASLKSTSTAKYNLVKAALQNYHVVMPPSAAIAGVCAATDASRGVWKAPANVGLADVIEPVVKIDSFQQEDLNVDSATGKSINVLRAFAGKGTLVWGARTLAGNDNEWRYISVRRFFNMVEESVKKSTYWAVFEPNDANTWVKVRGMIGNYLIDKWRDGALAGATPKEAFFVKCGLGVTMTAQDILEGRMNVEIGMAVVRPAEFIILKFTHKLQTS